MKRINMMSKKMWIFTTVLLAVLIGFLSFTATFYYASKEMRRNMEQAQSSEESGDELRNESESESEIKPETKPDEYHFASDQLLKENYEDYGKAMGFSSAKEYELAAVSVINDYGALHKEKDDNGYEVYFIESTGEFVKVSEEGYILEYFKPDAGKMYFDSQ